MINNINNVNISKFLDVLNFVAEKHKGQVRKGSDKAPYINHLIQVAALIAKHYANFSQELLHAALLHDVVEDTDVSCEEISEKFGNNVAKIVMEVTDNKDLPKEVRKQLQISEGKHKSLEAKVLKIADKITNIKDVIENPPINWTWERRMEYLNWSEAVVNQKKGVCKPLEDIFDTYLQEGKLKLFEEKGK